MIANYFDFQQLIAVVTCDDGFQLVGGNTTKCLADGQWQQPFPACIGRKCDLLDSPTHGIVTFNNDRRYPSVATFNCNPGYELNGGSNERVCLPATGKFDGASPECVGRICEPIFVSEHNLVRVIPETYRFPAQAKFSCKPGYEIFGPETISCSTNAKWPTMPICQGIKCPVPEIANAIVNASSARYPSFAVADCLPGYEIIGQALLKCSIMGTWEPLPFCKECPIDMYSRLPALPCIPCPRGTSTNGTTGKNACHCVPGKEPIDEGDGCKPCSGLLENVMLNTRFSELLFSVRIFHSIRIRRKLFSA